MPGLEPDMGDTEQLGLHARPRVSKFFSKGPDSKIFQALQAIVSVAAQVCTCTVKTALDITKMNVS